MRKLLSEIRKLEPEIGPTVRRRLREFKNNKDHFSELCFCILTANTSAEMGIKCQREIGGRFRTLPKKRLAAKLKSLGYRFYNRRAEFIAEARSKEIIPDRDWLVKNIKGIGMKEASHFLRNIGFDDYAIIDFHIVDLLVRHSLIQRPKTMTRKRYLEIEDVLRKLAKKAGLTLAELDLYLWYMETGKILK